MAFKLTAKQLRTLAHSAPAEGEYYVDCVAHGDAWQAGPFPTIDDSVAQARRMAEATGRMFRTEFHGRLVLLVNGVEESYCAGTTLRREQVHALAA